MPPPNRHIFSNFRKGTQEWENQCSATIVQVTKGHYGGLCERREESNEAGVECWSDSSLCIHIENASLKSLLGACDLLC